MIPLSVCIIGKNEEKNIDKCLAPLTSYDFEIVYVDTGSTDRTKELAAKYTDNIYDFTWVDDFSAARNFSLEKASRDYVLVLDCDEYLTDLDLNALCTAIEAHPEGVGQIIRNSYIGNKIGENASIERIDRLFDRRRYHYIYTIHEQVADIRTDATDYERFPVPVTVDHMGYVGTADEKRKKAERNNLLLFQEIERNPTEPYFYFQAAQSYNLIDDYENAYQYYKKAFALPLNPDNLWVHVMANNFITACIQTSREEEALALYTPVYDIYAQDAAFLCCMASLYLNLSPPQPMKAMMEFVKVLQAPISLSGEDLSGAALYGMGYSNELLGNLPAANSFYEKAAAKNYPAPSQNQANDSDTNTASESETHSSPESKIYSGQEDIYSDHEVVFPPISVCIIGKNEEKNIERCLAPLAKRGFEIIYVDTGSTDRTKELAAKYTDNLYDFEWIGDFSAARNFSISKASHNYVLIIDCDEFLTQIDPKALEQAIDEHPRSVGTIQLDNYCESDGGQICISNRLERLFHKRYYHYENPIHEQICDIKTGSTYYERYDAPIVADHVGYAGTAEERRRKTERNNELLFQEIAKHPDDPYHYFQAAQSFNLIDDYENAYVYYKKAFALGLDTENPWVYVMANNFINTCVQLGRGDEALSLYLPVYDDYANNPAFLSSIGSLYLDLEPPQPLKAVMEFVKVLQAPISSDGIDYSPVALYGMGYSNELMGNAPAALDFYRKSAEKNYPLAQQKLSELQFG
ncbi:MAG: glycosyltransferase family 2 protein [Lachnospiraceae bacterium]|nr:glycosyltransferase family 2 protein [Lachnospiraceae bacterium]